MKKLLRNTTLITVILLIRFTATAQQQFENSMSQYFNNRTLWNSAFTGMNGARIYAMQNRSWVGFEGAPVMTNITGECNFGDNSAAGIQIVTDVAGALYRTFGVLNYAYKVKLNEAQQIRIGISLALSSDRLNTKYVDEGGAVDPLILNNINSAPQFDGNIGTVYTYNKLTVGASFFRIKEQFKGNNESTANLVLAQIGGTYDIDLNNDEALKLKPLLQLRLYRKTNPLLDLGGQFEYNKLVNAMLVYQTSGNIRAGAGVRIKDFAEANFFYNTNTKVANAASQQYELGFAFYFKKK